MSEAFTNSQQIATSFLQAYFAPGTVTIELLYIYFRISATFMLMIPSYLLNQKFFKELEILFKNYLAYPQ